MTKFSLFQSFFCLLLVLLLLLSPSCQAFTRLFYPTKVPASATLITTMPPHVNSQTSVASSTAVASTASTSTAQQQQEPEEPCRLGFIGTGTIASCIVTGFATQTNVSIASLGVSRRSAAKSQALADRFPDLVTVYDDNQALVDQSDILFITVLPEQTKQVLQAVTLDPQRHVLVSLVSTSNLESLAADSGLPLQSVYKMICLPAVATHDGVCLLTPARNDHKTLLHLLESLGGVVQAETEQEMSVMMVPSALMGSFYGILKNNQQWLERQGIPPEKASFLIGRQYHSMMVDAQDRCADPGAFQELIEEQTPGGLNEQGLANLEQLGALQMYDKVQDALLDRITGQSDGSLKEE